MRWIRKSPCPGTVSTFIAAVNIQLSQLMILINFGYIKKRILQFIKKRVHKRERGACVSAEERSVYSLADSLACSWEFLKTWGRVVFFPSLDTQFTSMNRSRCTHTRTDCHTHTHIIKIPTCLSSDSVTGWGNVYHRNVQYVNDTKTSCIKKEAFKHVA